MMTGFNRQEQARGQVSLEFLVLFAAFLAFLGIWLGVIARTGEGVQAGVEAADLQATGARLASALDSACLMGDGNVRIVEAQLAGAAQVEVRGDRLFLIGEKGAVRQELKCDAGTALFELQNGQKVEVRREAGATLIAPMPIS
ncbi:MAG: class III signal peptide-containing protein [Candidatus Micrarchaeia archaeon]|jgi:hypothetical protein